MNDELFAAAGLYEWRPGKNGAEAIESFSIVTTDANEMVAKLHDRMPAILDRRDHDTWLDQRTTTRRRSRAC